MKIRSIISIVLMLGLAFIYTGCPSESALEPPAVKTGTADFSTVVAVGNSLTAGFTDGALGEFGQNFSYPSLIAGQMNAPFNQPALASPGLGGVAAPGVFV